MKTVQGDVFVRETDDALYEKLDQTMLFLDFFDEYETDKVDTRLGKSLIALIDKKGYTKAQVIKDSGINRRFFFDILSCKRKPARDYVLRILIALKVPLEDVQKLLCATGYPQLNAQDHRDSVIIDILARFSLEEI